MKLSTETNCLIIGVTSTTCIKRQNHRRKTIQERKVYDTHSLTTQNKRKEELVATLSATKNQGIIYWRSDCRKIF